jgi:hypothetical protein
MGPALQGLGVLQGSWPFPEQGQVVKGVQDVLFTPIAARVNGQHFPTIGNLYPIHKGPQEQGVIAGLHRHTVAVGLEGDQAQAVGPDRQSATAGEGPFRQRKQVRVLLLPEFSDGVLLPTQSPAGLGQALLPEEGVQLLEGGDLGQWHQEVAPGVAYQVLHQAFLMGFSWSAKTALKEVVASEGNEGLLFLELPAHQPGPHGLGEVVIPDVLGHASEKGEGLLVPRQERLLLLVGKGHDKRKLGVAEPQPEELHPEQLARHDALGFAEITLGVFPRLIGQGNEKMGMPRDGAMLSDILAYVGLLAREAIFCHQPLIDAVGSMALLGRARQVFRQPLMNEADKGAEDRSGPRLAQGITRWPGISQGLPNSAPMVMALSGDLADAFTLNEVGSPNLFPLVHLKHSYLRLLEFPPAYRNWLRWGHFPGLPPIW